MSANPFDNDTQNPTIMESVVLDNDPVVFEDVISSNSSSDHRTSDPSDNNPLSTPKSDPTPAPTFSSSYPEQSFAGESYRGADPGAFAPEYRAREPSFQEPFRETTSYSSEAQSTAAPVDLIPIDVNVTEPEKFGEGMNSYITYKIKTKTNLPKFKENSVVVRRYNDFLWFHEQLRLNNKGVLIPPLPEKAIINRFSPEFIETRRKELEKFLNRVVQHQVLHRKSEVAFFLQSSEEQFTAAKSKAPRAQPAPENPPPQQQSSGGGGIGSFFSAIGHSITAVSNLTTTGGVPREIDQWFDSKKNYVNTLEGQLATLQKYVSKLMTKRKELASAYSDFSSSMSIVGSCEAESDKYISNSFIRIAQIADHIKDLAEQLFRNETTHFEEALKDYLRVLGAVKDMLADRDEVLLEYQNATRAFDTKRDKMDRERARGGAKNRTHEQDVEAAQKKVEETKREYESISTRVRSELEVFDVTRAREIRRMISLLVQSNMEHSLQVVDQWKSYISESQGGDEKDWKTSDKIGWGGVGALR